MNQTPSGERTHIAFLGRRNAGKSSLVNAFAGQEVSIVSDVRGTTTDPVSKSMELLPLGPVLLVDTPGIDDEGDLGELRVRRARQVLNRADLALLVADATAPLGEAEQGLLELVRQKGIPCVVVHSKADLLADVPPAGEREIWVSARTGLNVRELREMAARAAATGGEARPLVADLLSPGDIAVLVVPIDKAAPKGRLILPQQQTIRDALEAGASSLVCRDTELASTLSALRRPPRLVITDSQAFKQVAATVPDDIPLTSFSILMARRKGSLEPSLRGVEALATLRDGDRVLIAEGCTHHRQCDDIGTVKLPRWIRASTGVEPAFSFTSGGDFPEDLSPYRLVVHCGGCMLNEREMRYRMRCCADQGVPVTNYGMLIAHMNGILPRALAPLREAKGRLS